mgnify:CR=1 FL=1
MIAMDKWHKFKPLPADSRQRLNQLNPLFAAENVLLAYLFGSLTHTTQAHDIDLALLMPPDKRPFYLQPAINHTLHTERVDIVDLRRATPVLAFEIISNGQILYAADETMQLDFERHVLRQYKDTAWLRQKQEQSLKERMKQWSSNATALPNA